MDFWPFKAAYYRVFQFVFDLGARVLPWRRAQLTEGAGSIRKVPALLQSAGVAHPLVVAGPRLMKSGLVSKLLSLLDTAGIAYSVFGDVEPNPSVATVDKIQARYLSEVCDGFIAIGGGSSMDAAKAAAARAANPGKSVAALGGLLKVRHPIDPFFAIPTTAGTGSETTIAAVVVDTDTHHKYAIMDLKLIPRDAILDPELTLGLPPAVTAATGMDALTHAVEAYLCRNNNTKESIRCAEDATVMIFQNLERAYRDGRISRRARPCSRLLSWQATHSRAQASATFMPLHIHWAVFMTRRTDLQTQLFSPSFWRTMARSSTKSSPVSPS